MLHNRTSTKAAAGKIRRRRERERGREEKEKTGALRLASEKTQATSFPRSGSCTNFLFDLLALVLLPCTHDKAAR